MYVLLLAGPGSITGQGNMHYFILFHYKMCTVAGYASVRHGCIYNSGTSSTLSGCCAHSFYVAFSPPLVLVALEKPGIAHLCAAHLG